ncbi:MAG: hypothetical protein IT562_24095 [Alphaproteobacteria bacterium]|nr:hypothetical protein [Alphaproteobacteria bacterium]
MVAPATTESPRDAVAIDHERILWDAEYRREIIQQLKCQEKPRDHRPGTAAGRHAA